VAEEETSQIVRRRHAVARPFRVMAQAFHAD